jgi:alcohol dehydrogenase, propanol-preferring
MKAMVIGKISDLETNPTPLDFVNEMAIPVPGPDELLVKVSVCGICHTDIDEIEGRTPPSYFPMIPGHQIIGRVEERGSKAKRFHVGERVGIAWIHSACGKCRFCLRGEENLCLNFKATGRDAPGGYAQYTVVSEDFAFKIPEIFSDSEAAPLLCAGAVGYRALRLTGMKNGQRLGLVGFGASAHLVIQAARRQYPDSRIFVFVRSRSERDFARELGAHWAGGLEETPPEELDCAIDTTPVWAPIVSTLDKLAPAGRLVLNAIRKEEKDKDALMKLDYSRHLWQEKEIKSVANVTRRDVMEFLQLAAHIPIRPKIQEFRLEEANRALMEIKGRKIRGSKVLTMLP